MPGWIWAIVAGLGTIIAATVVFGLFWKPSEPVVLPEKPIAAAAATMPAPAMTPTKFAPTAASAPTGRTVDPNLLFDDDFDDPKSGWSVFGGPGERSQVGYSNGKFRIAFYRSACGFDSSWSLKEYTDFVVETVFSTPAAVPDIGGGLTLRAQNAPDRWYLLWFYPSSGGYRFIKNNAGKVTELVPLSVSSAIQPGEKAGRYYLKLKVEARGGKFDIWVGPPDGDYNFVASVSDDAAFTKGRLGPSAECPQKTFTPPAEVLFEWIKVYR